MGLNLSDSELEAMDGLPHLHRCLYIFGIRRYMDFKTGITGIKREISYKSLAEEIYEEPIAGIKMTAKSRDQIKRALTVLEKKGLIKRQSIIKKDEKILILSCLLAKRDESVQNKAAPRPPHPAAPQTALVDNSKNNIETNTYDKQEKESRPTSRPSDFEKAARHPYSGKLNNNNNTRQQFLDLLTAKRFPVSYLADDRTRHMLDTWEQAGITQDEAVAAIKHGDNEVLSRQGRVTVPWYYQDIPFQLRGEVKHDKRQQTDTHRKPSSDRYPKSATRQFWENQSAILRQIAEDES
jgi:hypothetical protein